MKLPFIGLMGGSSDNTLYTSSGKKLFKVFGCIAWCIQRIQHWIAKIIWRYK
jgi:hypothetical protein